MYLTRTMITSIHRYTQTNIRPYNLDMAIYPGPIRPLVFPSPIRRLTPLIHSPKVALSSPF
jgi:hypothetical protein